MAVNQTEWLKIQALLSEVVGESNLQRVHCQISDINKQIAELDKQVAAQEANIAKQANIFTVTLKSVLDVLGTHGIRDYDVNTIVNCVKDYACETVKAEGFIRYNEITQAGRTERGSKY